MTLSFKKILFFSCFFILLLSLCIPVYAEEAKKPLVIVSLGDSFSSGEGVRDEAGNTFFFGQTLPFEQKVNNADWIAHRSQKSWPAQLKISENETALDYKNENWFFAAASGATTEHITNNQPVTVRRNGMEGIALLPPQISVFETEALKNSPPDYVTLTIGGNDAEFTNIISIAATNFFNASALPDTIAGVWERFYAEGGIRDSIYNVYKEIHQKTEGKSTILVAGYPKLLAPGGDGFLFSQSDAAIINQAVSEFNVQINAIVEQCKQEGMDIHFIPVEEAFDNHGAYAEDAYINPIILSIQSEDLDETSTASSYSVHPNQKGAAKYAELVNAKIAELESGGTQPSFLYALRSPDTSDLPKYFTIRTDAVGNFLISTMTK